MASFILTEADEEQIPKPSRIRPLEIESDKSEDENDDQPTQSDNDFINDEPEEETEYGEPNQPFSLEEMEKKLEEKKKNASKKRGRPPSNKVYRKQHELFSFLKKGLTDLLIFTVTSSTKKNEDSRYCDTTSTTTS